MTCPLCQHTAQLFIAARLTPQQFFSTENGYSIAASEHKKRLPVFVCSHCGHGFTPIDIDSSVIEHWYESTSEDQVFLADEKARRTTARKILQRIEKRLPGKGYLLDIGSGPGIFVSEAVSRGWQASGLEASSRSAQFAQEKFGVAITAGSIDSLKNMPAETFDVVSMFDVIEHVVDPELLVKLAARVLKPNGWLIITTPKFDSVVARLMGKRWYCIFPAHIHYFTNQSLYRVLHHAGLTVRKNLLHTRYLSIRYFWQRLQEFFTGQHKKESVSFHSVVMPVNFGDEFELYAQKN